MVYARVPYGSADMFVVSVAGPWAQSEHSQYCSDADTGSGRRRRPTDPESNPTQRCD